MFKNYLKTAWRNLLKNKTSSIINISGLAVGMAVAMLIGLWVYDEVTFNESNKNYESIAEVRRLYTDPNTHETFGVDNMHYPTAALLRNNYSQYFKHVVIAWWLNDYAVSTADKKISRQGEFIEPEGLDMLSPKMLEGNYGSLNDMHSIVISKSTSKALFGNDDPINKSLKIDNRINVIVKGVYEDIAANSDYGTVQFFAPWSLWVASNDWIQQAENSWDNSSFPILAQLKPNVSMATANAAIKDFYYNSVPKEVSTGMKLYKYQALLYPMKDWHLYSDFKNGLPDGGRITFVWLFGIIGFFVLLLACINFMNLSTARAEKRAKEVGIRKTMGSLKRQLIQQFLSESSLVVMLAFMLSLLLVALSLPWFNELADKKISIPFSNPFFWLINLAFIIVTALLAGAYPSFYLSAFQPVKVLKGTIRLGRFASLPRKVLVIVQFTVSVILIIGTIVVFNQIQFAKDRPVGYNRNGLIGMEMGSDEIEKNFNSFALELKSSGVITEIARVSTPMTAIHSSRSDVLWKEKNPHLTYDFGNLRITSNYGKTTNWKILEGRDFSDSLMSDSFSVVLNEAAVHYMGLKNPLGEIIRFNDRNYTIIGIVKDMVMTSPYEPARQTLFYLSGGDFDNMVMRINPTLGNHKAINQLSSVFKKYSPSVPFIYKFVDDEYASKFDNEERIGKLAGAFAILAIFISCLGLFGMASFSAEQRIKEIGIRKVLGASVINVWSLLSGEFVILVLITLLVAIPIAYYLMDHWLQNYQYRTGISWWVFAITGIAAILITLLTVSFQTIKAALTNPVNCLRTE